MENEEIKLDTYEKVWLIKENQDLYFKLFPSAGHMDRYALDYYDRLWLLEENMDLYFKIFPKLRFPQIKK